MELHAYPRPEDDTGIGIHWCAGASAATPDMVEAFWLPELIELGVKWVKIASHRDALQLSQALLAAQIMPVVQIVRDAPDPGPFSSTELEEMEQLIGAGVRYFEFDSEPDRASFWRQDKLPSDALAVTARAAAANMQAILERGGLPAIPALTPKSDWQLAKEIQRVAGDALFDQPIWLAIHNYSSNRPPQYPEDAAHRDGAPLARELYIALAAEAWQENPWQGRSLAEINDLRRRLARKTAQPEASESSAPNDWRTKLTAALAQLTSSQFPPQFPPHHVHWRAFERLNDQVCQLIGRSLPILSTANGYLINENADPRYPATTPTLHMAQTLEICREMMGSSRHTPPAPDFYFCTAFWLLAHDALQSEGSVDEQSAWYSPLHLAQKPSAHADTGEARDPEAFGWSTLPIVPLLKAEPKQPRAVSAAEDAPPGFQTAQETPTVPLLPMRPTGEGVISGKVRGGAGAQLRLTHSDGFAYESLAGTNGLYRFVEMPAGRYSLEVISPNGSRVDEIDLAPAQELTCDLSVYGWGFEIDQRPVQHGRMLTCNVELLPNSAIAKNPTDGVGSGQTGTTALRISGDGQKSWVTPMARSGEGQTAHCEVGPLPSDSYRLEVLGVPDSGAGSAKRVRPLNCQAPIHRGMVTDVLLVHSHDEKRAAPRKSAISGAVHGGDGCTVRLRAEDGSEHFAEPDENGDYAFNGLPAGAYFLDVKYRHVLNCPRPLALDGRNQARCDLTLLPDGALPAPPEPALLQGQTQPGAATPQSRSAQPLAGAQVSHQVALINARGQRYVTQVEPSGAFQFDCLPAGDYDLYAEGFDQRGIHLEAGDRFSIQLWQAEGGWSHHARIQTDAETPGLIRVQWLEPPGLAITVENVDSGEEESRAHEAEPPYRAEFGPFPPGRYRVHSPELPVCAEVHLCPDEAAVVTFVRDQEPAQS